MAGATSSVPCMGILAIFLVTMIVWPADASTGWDCNDALHNVTAVSFASVMSETEIPQSKSFGTSHPDEFAYQFKGVPGYTAIIDEDKFYIVRCKPVIVIMQPQDKCYDRLPILMRGQKMFLTPWTHIITNRANEISCDAPNLQDYELEAITYKVGPRPRNPLEPERLKPKIKLTWRYQDLDNQANSGIYNENDMGNAWDRMNHPEQFNPPPAINYVFPDADGNTPGVIYNRDPHHIPWYKYLNTYSMLAIAAIVIIGVLVIAFIVKLVIDKVKHGSALHSVNRAYMSLCGDRQRRRQADSNQAGLKIRLNKPPDVYNTSTIMFNKSTYSNVF